jgi:hypothetical protein
MTYRNGRTTSAEEAHDRSISSVTAGEGKARHAGWDHAGRTSEVLSRIKKKRTLGALTHLVALEVMSAFSCSGHYWTIMHQK